jgi:hypothetical protein
MCKRSPYKVGFRKMYSGLEFHFGDYVYLPLMLSMI